MTLSPNDGRQLRLLLSALREKRIEREQSGQLKEYLRQSGDARRLYLEHFYLSSMLRWLHDDLMAGAVPTDEPSVDASIFKLRSLPKRTPKTRSLFGWRTAFVAACFYGAFLLLTWNLLPNGPHGNPSLDSIAVKEHVVGTLTRAENCRWEPAGAIQPGDKLTRGKIKLQQGIAQLDLVNGVTLTIEGPTEYDLRSVLETYLQRGRVVAQVPQRATGFAVATSTARVVDLGTEFAVEADRTGATEVQVLQGKVELHPRGSAKPIQLGAGAARRVESSGKQNGVIVREVTAAPQRYAQLRTDASTREIRVEGAFATDSITEPNLDAKYLIHGHGLKGDRHTSHWHQAMWHSAYGKIKNVVVAFDFGRAHRVQSMKVWNMNDDRFSWAGVKQADIYVSVSGKGDPLTRPTEWTLVITDQKFSPGTGKDDYAIPTVISLRDAKARFVAMVIDEALGSDPRPEGKGREPDIVGLSEVQFFGRCVESAK